MLAFSTASSEAAYPRTLEALDRFGVPPRIASFVLPLGYSFNLDGSMMYMTFATIFIAQAYGIHLSLGQEITMLLVLMITSKGMAGVPRASLVVIAATMSMFRIPEAGLLLILAVDHFLDMGRSATNVVGNAVAASVVARWEGELDPEEPADIEPPHAPSHVERTGTDRRSLLASAERLVDARRRLGEELRARLGHVPAILEPHPELARECRSPARRKSTCRARAASSRRGRDRPARAPPCRCRGRCGATGREAGSPGRSPSFRRRGARHHRRCPRERPTFAAAMAICWPRWTWSHSLRCSGVGSAPNTKVRVMSAW